MSGRTGKRPLAAHRFEIVVDLVTAGDIDDESLASTLVQLSTAGLYGMVSEVVSASLDGIVRQGTEGAPDAEFVRTIRPPSDPRISQAIRELDATMASLKAVMGEERIVVNLSAVS